MNEPNPIGSLVDDHAASLMLQQEQQQEVAATMFASPSGPARMLQPPKSVLRVALTRACDLIEKQRDVIVALNAKVAEHERWLWPIYGVGVLTGVVIGWTTA